MPLAFITSATTQEHDDHQQLAAPLEPHPALGGAERDQWVRARVEAEPRKSGRNARIPTTSSMNTIGMPARVSATNTMPSTISRGDLGVVQQEADPTDSTRDQRAASSPVAARRSPPAPSAATSTAPRATRGEVCRVMK